MHKIYSLFGSVFTQIKQDKAEFNFSYESLLRKIR